MMVVMIIFFYFGNIKKQNRFKIMYIMYPLTFFVVVYRIN